MGAAQGAGRAVPRLRRRQRRRGWSTTSTGRRRCRRIDFLRDVGKHFRVNQMIRKEAIAARLASQEGISYTEFSYQLLQALDYLELYRRPRLHAADRRVSDQWGNITAGVDLVHRAEGASVHALTTPLITDATARSTASPRATRSGVARHDRPVRLLPVLAQRRGRDGRPAAQVLQRPRARARSRSSSGRCASEPFRRRGAARAGRRLTTLVHGADATAAVQAAVGRRCSARATSATLDERTLLDATAELPRSRRSPAGTSVVDDLLVAVGPGATAQGRPPGDRGGRRLR